MLDVDHGTEHISYNPISFSQPHMNGNVYFTSTLTPDNINVIRLLCGPFKEDRNQ